MEGREAQQLVEYLGHLSKSQALILERVEDISRAQTGTKAKLEHLEEGMAAFDLQAFQALSAQLQHRNAAIKRYLEEHQEEARRYEAMMQRVEPILTDYSREAEMERAAREKERGARAKHLIHMDRAIYAPGLGAMSLICMVFIYFVIKDREQHQQIQDVYGEMIRLKYDTDRREMRLDMEKEEMAWLEELTVDEQKKLDDIKACIEKRKAQVERQEEPKSCLKSLVKP